MVCPMSPSFAAVETTAGTKLIPALSAEPDPDTVIVSQFEEILALSS
jgi:hypothetical protein